MIETGCFVISLIVRNSLLLLLRSDEKSNEIIHLMHGQTGRDLSKTLEE